MSDDLDSKDTLKRHHDDPNGPVSKRPHFDDDALDSVQVKVLIPSSAVGAIIGKGGETMRVLKNESKCRVQMSKNQEMYPGTNERICLVKGKVKHVMMVMEAISEKIREKVEGTTRDLFDHKDVPRAHEVKLLMPNTSAGMVIGKAGTSIKEIREASGCQIQVYPKAGSAEAKNSLERVVTIAHEESDKLMEAVQRVLEKVAADPQHANAVDSKDSENFGLPSQQSYSSTNSSYTFAQPAQTTPSFASSSFSTSQYNGGGSSFAFNPLANMTNSDLLNFLDNLQQTLRSSGFNESTVAEIMAALQVLAKYNIMGLGLGIGVAAMAQMRTTTVDKGFSQQSHYGSTSTLDNSFSTPLPTTGGTGQCWGYSASQIQSQQTPQFKTILNHLKNVDAGGFAASVIIAHNHGSFLELEVPDSYVGGILGSRARTLNEIQLQSGCKVTVHKRGEGPISVGEDKRVVSLVGDPEQMSSARNLIERAVNEIHKRREIAGHV